MIKERIQLHEERLKGNPFKDFTEEQCHAIFPMLSQGQFLVRERHRPTAKDLFYKLEDALNTKAGIRMMKSAADANEQARKEAKL